MVTNKENDFAENDLYIDFEIANVKSLINKLNVSYYVNHVTLPYFAQNPFPDTHVDSKQCL